MDKYKGKYRIDTARARFWDYGWNASYFVTINTRNRVRYFGQVIDGRMDLSDIGRIAEECWMAIPDHFPFVRLGAHIIMPDHVHGIVTIDKPDDGRWYTDGGGDDDGRGDGDAGRHNTNGDVETQNFASLRSERSTPQSTERSEPPVSSQPTKRPHTPTPPNKTNRSKNRFGPQSKNLGSIIRGFKIGVTKNARAIDPGFAWQTRYHDHIIRNKWTYGVITRYIINNPKKWTE